MSGLYEPDPMKWRPGVNGASKRPWFVWRPGDGGRQELDDARGRLRRFASRKGAASAADVANGATA